MQSLRRTWRSDDEGQDGEGQDDEGQQKKER